jgi:hypothetical protein
VGGNHRAAGIQGMVGEDRGGGQELFIPHSLDRIKVGGYESGSARGDAGAPAPRTMKTWGGLSGCVGLSSPASGRLESRAQRAPRPGGPPHISKRDAEEEADRDGDGEGAQNGSGEIGRGRTGSEIRVYT